MVCMGLIRRMREKIAQSKMSLQEIEKYEKYVNTLPEFSEEESNDEGLHKALKLFNCKNEENRRWINKATANIMRSYMKRAGDFNVKGYYIADWGGMGISPINYCASIHFRGTGKIRAEKSLKEMKERFTRDCAEGEYYTLKECDEAEEELSIYCEVCGKELNKDGVCNDCGLPSKDAFLKALTQASGVQNGKI